MKEEVRSEMKQLREELRRRPTQTMMFSAPIEERNKITFAGNKWENSMEFLANIEKEMEKIGSAIDDNEKIDFVTRHFKDSASQWCSIIRDNITTYRQFRDAFENRYWNIHIQRQVRDQLEYGKFNMHGRTSIEPVSYTHLNKVVDAVRLQNCLHLIKQVLITFFRLLQ